MAKPDLNLLVALNALLEEGSVTGAAKRLNLSPSAMSRALARLRETMADPLLVRAGRGLVPTPRALELRAQVQHLVQTSTAVLRPAEHLDLSRLARTFTIRTREGFVESFGPNLLRRLDHEAPGVHLHFIHKTDRDSLLLRNGTIDLETGVVSPQTSPELRAKALFKDHFVGVVREGHPLAHGTVTAPQYEAERHVCVLRPSQARGPFSKALASAGLKRNVVLVVGGFSTALAMARETNLIATVPKYHTAALRRGMHTFTLPIPVPNVTVSLLWHPRQGADAAHRWLRECIAASCSAQLADQRA